jgi:Tol biopolymer transport system component
MHFARIKALPVLLTGAVFIFTLSATPSAAQNTSIVSVSSTGAGANSDSADPSITADGQFVAFSTAASTLVPGDSNGIEDIFVRDTVAGMTSILTSGEDAPSFDPSISANGRYVAFWSASAFSASDTNKRADVYVRDRWSNGLITLASVATDGTLGDNFSVHPSISGDGRYVAFESIASTLVPGDTNGRSDVFVRDMITHTTTRVSVATDGTQANGDSDVASVSVDGNRVAFHSTASNLVPGDTNGTGDVFVRDLVANTTTRVSVATDGTQANGDSGSYMGDSGGYPSRISVSKDGRFVAFRSAASNLVSGDTNGQWDIFVRDLTANTTTRVSVATDGTEANGNSYAPSISGDGEYVAFASAASNLVDGDTNGQGDIFGRDINAGTTARLSLATDGTEANQPSDAPVISVNGRFATFRSNASNLVPGDTGAFADVFLRGPLTSPTAVTGQANVNGLSATLFGVVNPNGAPATAWFDYGPTTAYGSSTTHISTGAQSTAAALVQTAAGLAPATTYHYRAVVDNGDHPVYGSDSYFVTGAPVWGTALRFDGASAVLVPFTHSVTGNFTVECWARPADMTSAISMLGSRSPSDDSFDMKFWPAGIHGDIGNGTKWLTTNADAPMTLTPGRWYHVAYVVSPFGYNIYVNGVRQIFGEFTGQPVLCDGSHHLIIGNYQLNGNEAFKGDLDDVRVWNTARTVVQIQTDYVHPLQPDTAGLVYYHRFDSGAGTVSQDDGAAGVAATFSGNPVWVPSTVPLPHYTVPDALAALRIAAGLTAASPNDAGMYAADPAAPGVVDLAAALNLLRAAVGTGQNP